MKKRIKTIRILKVDGANTILNWAKKRRNNLIMIRETDDENKHKVGIENS
jgi:hypothetical protein